jgi:hypothetical protein
LTSQPRWPSAWSWSKSLINGKRHFVIIVIAIHLDFNQCSRQGFFSIRQLWGEEISSIICKANRRATTKNRSSRKLRKLRTNNNCQKMLFQPSSHSSFQTFLSKSLFRHNKNFNRLALFNDKTHLEQEEFPLRVLQ